MANLFTNLSKNVLCTVNGPRMDRHHIENGPIHSRQLFAVLVMLLCLGVGNVWGATETLTMSEMGWDNASIQSSIPASSATIALAKNSVSTAPTYYTSDGLRIYGVKSATTGGTIAFTAVDEITQIQFTHTAQNSGVLSIKSGGGSYSSKKWTGTLTAGNTLTLVATNSGTKAPQVRITVIAITYKAKVTFNANGGSCATANATQSTPTSTVTLPTPTRAGFTCTGWYTASSGGTKRGNAGATYTPSASETLYAQWESSAPACSNAVALSKGSATNGTVNTISSASVATCSATASDRRVTVTITPAACYDAPSTLTWTKSSGTVSASKQSGPTDNGNGTYSYVYQFAQNNNGAGTFGVTCTAKAAGKTVNFDAGPGVSASSSLTETCDGSGVTLPAVTATGVCKGWTTFAGWATSAVSDSTTTSVSVSSAGSEYTPASNNMTLYAVYSKVKSGGAPVSVSGGDMDDGVGLTGWTTSGAGAYSGNGVKFDDANDYVQSPDLSSNNYKALTVKLKAGHNGGSGSVLTIASLDGSGNVIDSETFTPSDAYDSQSTLKTIDLSGSSVIKYIRVTMTSKTKNLGMKYCEVFTPGTTTYYCSDPNCCTELGSINGSFF